MKMRQWKIVALMFVLVVACGVALLGFLPETGLSCQTGHSIRPNMKQQQVERFMGTPTGTSGIPGRDSTVAWWMLHDGLVQVSYDSAGNVIDSSVTPGRPKGGWWSRFRRRIGF